ncbi:MAG: hypothetical protein RL653_1592 [Pseudomonadota bacterium]|jgi:hypothetical protein
MQRLAFLLACVLAAAPARAHDADLVTVQLTASGDGLEVEETWALTAETLGLLAPVDADGDGLLTDADLAARADAVRAGVWDAAPLTSAGRPCLLTGARARVGERTVGLTGTFRCPVAGEWVQTFRFLSVLPSGYRVVVGDVAGQRFAQGQEQMLVVSPPPSSGQGSTESPRPPSGFGGWVLLGVEHILVGWDHLAFLAALLLAAVRLRAVLWIVTAFTLAHSVTLGAAALGWVTLGARGALAVEVIIALSIAVVAAENLLRDAPRQRPAVAFGFGLVHGFGFASVLKEYGLGDQAVRALLGFNLGVELGQAAVVAVTFPLLAALRPNVRVHRWVHRAGSAALVLAGIAWALARLTGAADLVTANTAP